MPPVRHHPDPRIQTTTTTSTTTGQIAVDHIPPRRHPPSHSHSPRRHPPSHSHSHPPPPPPRIRIRFDPYNSSASGHQQDPGNRLAGSTAWRASRTAKLAHQFEGGVTGGIGRIADSVGAGAAVVDDDDDDDHGLVVAANGERKWRVDAGLGRRRVRKGVEEGGEREDDVFTTESEQPREPTANTQSRGKRPTAPTTPTTTTTKEEEEEEEEEVEEKKHEPPASTSTSIPSTPPPRKIFQGLTIYINGSTAPLVSDHRLKQLLAQHGAGVSISLARRTVTHVVLGTPNGGGGGCVGGEIGGRVGGRVGGVGGGGGAGGGLAGRKIQKEIKRVRGCGIKYVGVEWILQSILSNRRLPEAPFSFPSVLAPQTQKSVLGFLKKGGKGGGGSGSGKGEGGGGGGGKMEEGEGG